MAVRTCRESRFRRVRAGSLLVVLASLGTNCRGTGEAYSSSISSRVIYGEDDREELAHSQYSGLRTLTMALIPKADLEASVSGVGANWLSIGAARGWCSGQRFAEQPGVAVCGGVAIAADYVLTASHCVPDRAACHGLAFVRGYMLDDEDRFAVSQLERYDCDDVVFSVESDLLAPEAFDFAIVHLASPIRDLPNGSPAIRTAAIGESVVSIAPSSGLPLKVSSGEVLDVDGTNGVIHAAIDFFAGGSGSGLFNGRGELLGIMVAGASDYVKGPGGCLVARIIDSSEEGAGEIANDASVIGHFACARDRTLPFCSTNGPARFATDSNTDGAGKDSAALEHPPAPSCALTRVGADLGARGNWGLAVVAWYLFRRGWRQRSPSRIHGASRARSACVRNNAHLLVLPQYFFFESATPRPPALGRTLLVSAKAARDALRASQSAEGRG